MEKKLHVLIVEDLPSDAELAERELRTVLKNFSVQVVDTQEGFEQALETFKPDLIISDYQMPAFNGLSALRIRQDKCPFTPFVILTGSMNEDTAVECMKEGADDYVIKEHIKRLGQAVLKALEKKKNELERKQAEEEQKRLISAIEQAADSVVITDLDAKILYVNPAFERLTGYEKEEVIGKNPSVLKSGKQDEAFYKNMWNTLTRGEIWQGEIINKSKDGTLFTEKATISPVLDSVGKTINYIGVKNDVTKQRILEEQLIQAQKMETVGQLAGGVAHDFNNMLSVILGYTELIMGKIDLHDPMLKELRQIQKAAQRSTDITRQLLAFSRKQVIDPEIVNLNPLVAEMEKMLGRLLGEDIDLSFIPAKNLWDTKIDKGQINQIVVNLGVNARDAMQNGGKLTIETANVIIDEAYCQDHAGFVPGRFVMLVVSDNGTGMDKEILSHIFEPFFTTKDEGKGTGLGLSTVYGIIKQHNGFINVYSELGHGTTFKLYFPRCEEQDKKTEIFVEAPKSLISGTILLAEDDDMVRDLTRTILEMIGYTVLLAETPNKALALCDKSEIDIDLLLTDVVMPQMSGKELKESIEVMKPGIKTLFMSGYTSEVISQHGVLDKGINFIQKPFTKAELAKKIRDVIDQ